MLIIEYLYFKHTCNYAHYSVHLYRIPGNSKKIITYIALGKEPYKTIRSLFLCNPLVFYLSNSILFIFIMVRYMVGLVFQELHKFSLRFQAKFLYCRAAFSDCRWDRSVHSAVAQQLTPCFSQRHCCWPNSFSVVFVLPLALNLVLSTPFTYLLDCMKESPRMKLVTGQVENRLTQGRNSLGTQTSV